MDDLYKFSASFYVYGSPSGSPVCLFSVWWLSELKKQIIFPLCIFFPTAIMLSYLSRMIERKW